MTTQRNPTFDILKGVAILLMMVCHLVYKDGWIHQAVFSFHMPLFFLVAGFFTKNVDSLPSAREMILKSVRRLLLPFYVTMFLLVVWGATQAYLKQDIAFLLRPTLSLLLANADPIDTRWGMPYAGWLWFLWALFFAKAIFSLIQVAAQKISPEKRPHAILAFCVLFSWGLSVIHPKISPLPFSIAQGGVALVFVALGWYAKQMGRVPIIMRVLFVACWPLAIVFGRINLESCTLVLYPLSVAGACGAVLLLYGVFSKLNADKCPLNFFVWCGVSSLAILCMHHLEMYSSIIYSLQCRVPQTQYLIGWGEMLIALAMAVAVTRLPYLKKIYR